jgi:hypothetical protein
MLDDGAGPRDVSRLQLPVLGHVDRDEHGAWQVFGADGVPMSAVGWFLADLSASDCADSTCRSYAYDLLRWFRCRTGRGIFTNSPNSKCIGIMHFSLICPAPSPRREPAA